MTFLKGRAGCAAVLSSLIAAALCSAQPRAMPPDGPPGGPPGRGPDRRGTMIRPGAVEDILEEMNLEKAQHDEIMAAVQEQRKGAMEKMRAARLSPEDQEKIRTLQQEMRAARDARDTAKMEQLRGELTQLYGKQREAYAQFETELHDAIVAKLRPDQVESFDKAWAASRENPDRGPGRGLRDMRRAAMGLDLSSEQRQQLADLFRDASKAEKPARGGPEAGPGRGEAERERMKELRTKIETILNDEQKKQFADRLDHRGGGRPPRGPRPPRGGEDMPPPDAPPPQ